MFSFIIIRGGKTSRKNSQNLHKLTRLYVDGRSERGYTSVTENKVKNNGNVQEENYGKKNLKYLER